MGSRVGGGPRPQPEFKEKMGQGRGGQRERTAAQVWDPPLLFGKGEDSTPCGSLEADRPGSSPALALSSCLALENPQPL